MSSRQFLSTVLFTLGILSTPASAQITGDGTVGTIVTPTGTTFAITGGTTAGTNLFHSFSDFSIPTGGTALFNNATSITNIFSRVTGSNLSNIDGTIQAAGTANLFLLNPNGIIFGANSSLNIGGSFFATTANSIVFGDGIEFSANATNASPLLSISVPVGLQMGSNPGNITVRGNGHTQIHTPLVVPFDRSNSTRGLEVSPGQSIGLVGGNIFLESGVLTAEDGRVELGAVGRNDSAVVGLASTATGWQVGYDGIANFGTITLNERSLIDASGVRGGSIHLQGRQVGLLNASTLLIQNFGSQSAGTIQVDATDTFTIRGNGLGGLARSRILTETLGGGKGANIAIHIGKLSMRESGAILAQTLGSASAGDINIVATDSVDVIGTDPTLPVIPQITTITFGEGAAGNLSISTGQLRLKDGGTTSSGSFGVGNAGNVTLKVKGLLEVSGVEPTSFISSNISVASFRSGDAGRLRIDAGQVRVSNGATLSSNGLASGNAGDTILNASEFVDIDGQFIAGSTIIPTEIISASFLASPIVRQVLGLPPLPTGEAGTLTINTPMLRVRNGATVSVRNDGTSGNAGSLAINGNSVVVESQGSISASATNGQGGNVQLTVNQLTVRDRGTVSVSSLGSGQAGSLIIDANAIVLDNQGSLQAEVNGGSQGNINLNVSDLLLLRRGSFITTNATGSATGGNIKINAGSIVAVPTENSDISANSESSFGGRVTITTNGIFGTQFRLQLTPLSDITASSGLGAAFSGTVDINQLTTDPSNGVLELSTALTDPSNKVVSGCAAVLGGNSFIVTGRGGLPPNPSNNLERDRPWSDLRDLSAFREGGNSTVIQAQVPEQIVEANSWRVSDRGTIELIATVPHQNLPAHSLNCDGMPEDA